MTTLNPLTLIISLLFITCREEKKEISPEPTIITIPIINNEPVAEVAPFDSFNRDNITVQLQNKILNKQPLVVHVFVPLCDNDNQGIVPVSASLGDGKNLKTNLYWGAGYGLKTHFKKTGWTIISDEIDTSLTVMERIVFQKTLVNGTKIIVIADAYAGDKMQLCLEDFFNTLAEKRGETVKINDELYIDLNKTDMVAFTGHNGLMDNNVSEHINKNAKQKDAVVIACISHAYFKEKLNYLNAYPLVTTTSLMAPEAYVLNAIINSWANMDDEKTIFMNAATAYSNYQKCSLKAAKNIFTTGW